MIALAFQSLAVWLGQNGRDFCRFQIIDAAARPPLDRNPQDLRALACGQRFAVRDKAKEAP